MNEPLNTNTRYIEATAEGFRLKSGPLCGSCGVRDLCGPTSTPQVCASFSPLFVFRSPLIGFDGFFNTFRLGQSNFNRFNAKLGTVVTLFAIQRKRILGYAEIKGVATGAMPDMLAQFAHTNHISLGRKWNKADAVTNLDRLLRKDYKKMFKTVPEVQPFSVIFMQRCEVPEFIKRDVA